MPQLHRPLHLFAAQVQVAVAQADRFVDLQRRIVQVEGRRLRCRENLNVRCVHFDVAGRQVRIARAVGPHLHRAGETQHEFVADLRHSVLHVCRGLGVYDYLCNAVAITHVDEDDAAMVAAPVHPSVQCNLFGNVFFA